MHNGNGYIYVLKKSGERELYSEEKVLHSMERVGIPQALQSQVLRHVRERLHNNITSAEIFHHILEFVRSKDPKASIRLSLKQAIMELGPTGFPFERYMGRIFEGMGYHVMVDQILEGECVGHEIDLVVEKDGKREIIEAKFHNQQGIKTDIQVLMYTYARFLDVSARNNVNGVWVVTNTKLSEDAIRYSRCKGVKAIAWNYPDRGNLQDYVEKPEMYPVTILSALSAEEKRRLLEKNIILSCDLLNTPEKVLIDELYIRRERLQKALESARMVCAKSEIKRELIAHELAYNKFG